MKARVKGTTDIIDVEFDKDALNAGYPPYHDREHNLFYQPEQLEWWIDVKERSFPKDDYWTRLEHQYAGMAMQGMITHYGEIDEMGDLSILSNQCVMVARDLVEKLKEVKQ